MFMSRTFRRTTQNAKRRFFKHYWEEYDDNVIARKDYIPLWKYHSDNYYTKHVKEMKQFYKQRSYSRLRNEFRIKINSRFDLEDFVLEKVKAECIGWMIH